MASPSAMSIAVTAIITTSPRLRAAVAAFGLLHAALAVSIAFDALGPFHLAPLLTAAHTAAAAMCCLCALQRPTPRRVDVSGLGQVTLTVQHELRRRTAAGMAMQLAPAASPVPVRLLPGSTFLSGLLVLELVDGQGARLLLPVLPDAVPGDGFRRLSVALRCVAARSEPFESEPEFFELIAGGQAPSQ